MPNETAAPAQASAIQAAPTRAQAPASPPSLIARFAARFGVEPNKMLATLKATAFRQRPQDPEPTNEQMMALLVVADQYGLNPWTREIYAFPDKGAIVPVVGLDGWSRIVNDHPEFDGVEFAYGPAVPEHKSAPAWIDCTIYRRDRSHPVTVREHLAECYRDTGPWRSHPARMLRHKAFMQAGRLAFSFVGVYDEDEAGRILDGEASRVADAAPAALAQFNAQLVPQPAGAPALTHAPAETVPAQVSSEADPVAVGAARQQPTLDTGRPVKSAMAKPPAPVFTFAEVADKISKASTGDALGEAVSLIDAVADETQRAELLALAEQRDAQIGEA